MGVLYLIRFPKVVINAVTGNLQSSYGTCPVTRLIIQVKFVGENAIHRRRKSHGALGSTFDDDAELELPHHHQQPQQPYPSQREV